MTAYYFSAHGGSLPFKPYDRRQVKRDIHEAGIVSLKMSAHVRRMRKQAARKREDESASIGTAA